MDETLQLDYKQFLDSTERDDLENTHKIWTAIQNTESQKVLKFEDVTLPIVKDKAGLSTIPVVFQDSTMHFVLDTGANFSVIQKLVASKLGLKIIPAAFTVEAATGLEINSSIAVAEKMNHGSITIYNAVFLVFDGEALSFPSIDYEIFGIIGFPVIRALEEIQLRKVGELFIPYNPADYAENNLALDEYIPIVRGKYNNDNLRFSFDTGAQQTSLYSSFYKKNKGFINANSKPTDLAIGGAGGNSEHKGFVLKDFNLKIGGKSTTLHNLQVFSGKIGNVNRLDGNLGQDFIKQFDTMIISFTSGALLFQ